MSSDKRDFQARLKRVSAQGVGVIVLAAGFSRRFGAIKLNANLDNGTTVIAQTLSRIRTVSDNIVVVTRPELYGLIIGNGGSEETTIVCPDAEQGMGHTLAYGVRHIQGWTGCLVCLGDMPFIGSATYATLLGRLSDDAIIVPEYEGRRGNPVGFGAKWFAELANASGDTGGRAIMKQQGAHITRVAVDDPAILQDIDTPEDLVRYQLK